MNITQIESLSAVLSRIDLSWRAKGIYTWIRSTPSSHKFNKGELIDILRGLGKEGVDSIRSALKELESAGLIQWETKYRSPTNGQNGKPGYVYLMHEQETGLYKIGSSKQPNKRAQSVASARCSTIRLLQVIPCNDMGHAERAFHKKYDHYRKDGEFFELPDWAVSAIKSQDAA